MILTSHQNKTRWLVFFTLDMRTYIRYNYRYRTDVRNLTKAIHRIGSTVIAKIGMSKLRTSEN